MYDFSKYLPFLDKPARVTFAVSATCWALLWLPKAGYVDPLPGWLALVLVGVGLLAGFLFVGSAVSGLWATTSGLRLETRRWWAIRKARREFAEFIPHLSEREKRIFAYLLDKNLKTFTADADGGYAGTLMAKGFVRIIARGGQQFDIDKVPFGVPDHVWAVLQERKSEFPYKPELGERGVEKQPWRIPWGAR